MAFPWAQWRQQGFEKNPCSRSYRSGAGKGHVEWTLAYKGLLGVEIWMKIEMSGKKESREREKVHDRGRWTKERWYPLHDDCSQSLLKTISKKIYLTFFLSFRNPPRFSYHYEILSPLPPPSLALFPSLTFTIEPPGFIGKVHLFPCLRLAV